MTKVKIVDRSTSIVLIEMKLSTQTFERYGIQWEKGTTFPKEKIVSIYKDKELLYKTSVNPI